MIRWTFGDPNCSKETPNSVQLLAERQYQRLLAREEDLERNQRPRVTRKFEKHIR